jgi:hypothetical protein
MLFEGRRWGVADLADASDATCVPTDGIETKSLISNERSDRGQELQRAEDQRTEPTTTTRFIQRCERGVRDGWKWMEPPDLESV